MGSTDGIQEGTTWAAGLSWEFGSTGPKDGDVVVLVHGFPENWDAWAKVMPALASEGYRVFAPCLPGYGKTSPPGSYLIDGVGEALAGFCETVGEGRPVHLLGHDWGGIIASSTASLHPDSLASVALACCAHPAAFSGGLSDPGQVKRSIYVGAFQIPGIEHLVLRGLVRKKFPPEVVAIDGIGEMRRALEYYRTNFKPWRLGSSSAGRIPIPGLVIHAERDVAIGEGLMRKTADQMDDLRGFEIIPSSHFIHRRHSDLLLAAYLPFLRDVSGTEGESKEPPDS